MGSAGRLLAGLRPYRRVFVTGLALGALASVFDAFTFSLLIPFLRLLFGAGSALAQAPSAAERVLATIVGGWLAPLDPRAGLTVVLLLIAATIAVKNLCLFGAGYASSIVQEGVVRDLRTRLFAHVQRLGLPFFGATRGGELAARVVADAEQARGAVHGLGHATRNAVLVTVYLALLFALSWRLALVALLVVPTVAFGMRPLLRAVRRRAGRAAGARGDLAAVAVESAAAARVVKAYAGEAGERRRFDGAAERARRSTLGAQRLTLLASPLSETLGAAALVVLLVASGSGVAGGALRPELFVTFVAVALRMLSPMKALAQFPALLAESVAATDRVFELLDAPPEPEDAADARTFPAHPGRIAFRDVWVRYGTDHWALRGVTLAIARGEVVALVGPSGAGKSTLVDLLPRFVEPTRGAVLVDGVPLAAFHRRSLRRALGIVSQDPVLFNDTARANIAYGDRAGASDAEVEAAARAANAHGFITRLPAGYDTVVGERGSRLSGGERQRVAIARALLRDPPILILDEATAQLDAEAEREVQEAIARLLEGRTVLVIAHRLATVARADRIIVLDAGRVVEAGSHEELVAAGGMYGRLHAMQVV